MSREAHVRFWEGAGVKSPRATQLGEAPNPPPRPVGGTEGVAASGRRPLYASAAEEAYAASVTGECTVGDTILF